MLATHSTILQPQLFRGAYLSIEDGQEATIALFRRFQHEETVFFLQTFIFLKYAEWGWTSAGLKKCICKRKLQKPGNFHISINVHRNTSYIG